MSEKARIDDLDPTTEKKKRRRHASLHTLATQQPPLRQLPYHGLLYKERVISRRSSSHHLQAICRHPPSPPCSFSNYMVLLKKENQHTKSNHVHLAICEARLPLSVNPHCPSNNLVQLGTFSKHSCSPIKIQKVLDSSCTLLIDQLQCPKDNSGTDTCKPVSGDVTRNVTNEPFGLFINFRTRFRSCVNLSLGAHMCL